MKSMARGCSLARAGFFLLTFVMAVGLGAMRAQNEPMLVPDAIDYQKLLPILPEPPSGWTRQFTRSAPRRRALNDA